MQTDALQRRSRHGPRQPLDESIELRERDFLIFESLLRHGPLPTHYLFELTKHAGTNFLSFQHRLTKLYHGGRTGAFLVRPAFQRDAFAARYQPLVYDLAPLAVDLLKERGRLPKYVPPRTDPMLHRFMGACVSASVELEATKQGLRFILKDEIFANPRCPEATRASNNPLTLRVGTRSIVPDDLFGLQYPDDGFRFFAVEIDRAMEAIRPRAGQTTFGAKLENYSEALNRALYRECWGVPNLLILTVTTSLQHMENLLEHVGKLGQKSAHFLFKAKPCFGTGWSVPPLMPDLVSEPWSRASVPFNISKAF